MVQPVHPRSSIESNPAIFCPAVLEDAPDALRLVPGMWVPIHSQHPYCALVMPPTALVNVHAHWHAVFQGKHTPITPTCNVPMLCHPGLLKCALPCCAL